MYSNFEARKRGKESGDSRATSKQAKSQKNMNRIEPELTTAHRWCVGQKERNRPSMASFYQIDDTRTSHLEVISNFVYIWIGFHSSDDGLCCFTVPLRPLRPCAYYLFQNKFNDIENVQKITNEVLLYS